MAQRPVAVSAETDVLVEGWVLLGYSLDQIKASLERHVREKVKLARAA